MVGDQHLSIITSTSAEEKAHTAIANKARDNSLFRVTVPHYWRALNIELDTLTELQRSIPVYREAK